MDLLYSGYISEVPFCPKRGGRIFPAAALPALSGPVSYTHLDVYKRQPLVHVFAYGMSGGRFISTVNNVSQTSSSPILFGLSPVSYTHLDVYKRQCQGSAQDGESDATAAVSEVH